MPATATELAVGIRLVSTDNPARTLPLRQHAVLQASATRMANFEFQVITLGTYDIDYLKLKKYDRFFLLCVTVADRSTMTRIGTQI
jgi:hypothetical protein